MQYKSCTFELTLQTIYWTNYLNYTDTAVNLAISTELLSRIYIPNIPELGHNT